MKDIEIIETIKKIKANCIKKCNCNECAFVLNNGRCQIMHLTGLLAEIPSRWKIEKIEEVICK